MITETSALVPTIADTVATHAAEAAHMGGASPEGEANMFSHLLHHVYDAREIELPFLGHVHLPQVHPLEIAGITIDLSVTKHVVFLWIGAAILILVAWVAARQNRRNVVPRGIGNLVEVFMVFVRDDIVIPNMGMEGIRYLPYLLTTFLYILIMNLLGLFPYGASATGNVNVTAGLAIIAFVMIQLTAIRAQGFGHYLAHLTGGVHWALWPIMIPIEILGLFTKPFALCIRLYANMTGGHIVIVSLIGLIFIFKSYIVAAGPVAFVVGISFLELFVAFLQAYVFTMLTALFMGLGMEAARHAHRGKHEH